MIIFAPHVDCLDNTSSLSEVLANGKGRRLFVDSCRNS